MFEATVPPPRRGVGGGGTAGIWRTLNLIRVRREEGKICIFQTNYTRRRGKREVKSFGGTTPQQEDERGNCSREKTRVD